MTIMVGGALLVGALVVWSLTRTVEPSTEGYVSTADTSAAPVPSPTTTLPVTRTSPLSAPAAGQTPPPARPAGDPSSIQRIAVEDLRAKMNRNEVTLIDVRDARAFGLKRIPGSINVPFASVESMLDQIPKDKPIVTYCT
jgi:hypothetical protein